MPKLYQCSSTKRLGTRGACCAEEVIQWTVPSDARPLGAGAERCKSLDLYKSATLLLGGSVNAITWAQIAIAGCAAIGITLDPKVLIGVGLLIAPLSSAALALAMAAR
jgi:hypothetical protein